MAKRLNMDCGLHVNQQWLGFPVCWRLDSSQLEIPQCECRALQQGIKTDFEVFLWLCLQYALLQGIKTDFEVFLCIWSYLVELTIWARSYTAGNKPMMRFSCLVEIWKGRGRKGGSVRGRCMWAVQSGHQLWLFDIYYKLPLQLLQLSRLWWKSNRNLLSSYLAQESSHFGKTRSKLQSVYQGPLQSGYLARCGLFDTCVSHHQDKTAGYPM